MGKFEMILALVFSLGHYYLASSLDKKFCGKFSLATKTSLGFYLLLP